MKNRNGVNYAIFLSVIVLPQTAYRLGIRIFALIATAAAPEAQRARRVELDQLAAKLDCEERNIMVEGDLDARPMGIGKGPKPPSYHLQTAVDVDTGLIVHHEVTSEPNDTRQL
jgi:hypothetical protein